MSHPISAIKTLRDHGLTLLEAKRAYEELLVQCKLRVHLPGVPDMVALKSALAEYGITADEVQHALVNPERATGN